MHLVLGAARGDVYQLGLCKKTTTLFRMEEVRDPMKEGRMTSSFTSGRIRKTP